MKLKLGGIYKDSIEDYYLIIVKETENNYYEYDIPFESLKNFTNKEIRSFIQNQIQKGLIDDNNFFFWSKTAPGISTDGYLGQIDDKSLQYLQLQENGHEIFR